LPSIIKKIGYKGGFCVGKNLFIVLGFLWNMSLLFGGDLADRQFFDCFREKDLLQIITNDLEKGVSPESIHVIFDLDYSLTFPLSDAKDPPVPRKEVVEFAQTLFEIGVNLVVSSDSGDLDRILTLLHLLGIQDIFQTDKKRKEKVKDFLGESFYVVKQGNIVCVTKNQILDPPVFANKFFASVFSSCTLASRIVFLSSSLENIDLFKKDYKDVCDNVFFSWKSLEKINTTVIYAPV
jgi:hypothetical protein